MGDVFLIRFCYTFAKKTFSEEFICLRDKWLSEMEIFQLNSDDSPKIN